jgi:hypothetical protein
MKEIEIKDTLNLSDGNEYVVCSKVEYERKKYLYLIDINNYKNVKFCEEVRTDEIDKVVNVEDAELIKTLIPMFYEASKGIIEELLGE